MLSAPPHDTLSFLTFFLPFQCPESAAGRPGSAVGCHTGLTCDRHPGMGH